MTSPRPKVELTDDEWRQKLTPAEFAVLREAGTERPFVGEYADTETEGVYECRACGAELFRSSEKFESHCGWPSFFDPANSDAVILRSDDTLGMHRVEVVCANCHSHLGHDFEGEGYPTPTDQRYCINSISLRLVPTEQTYSTRVARIAQNGMCTRPSTSHGSMTRSRSSSGFISSAMSGLRAAIISNVSMLIFPW